jgi:hypothetical protein
MDANRGGVDVVASALSIARDSDGRTLPEEHALQPEANRSEFQLPRLFGRSRQGTRHEPTGPDCAVCQEGADEK